MVFYNGKFEISNKIERINTEILEFPIQNPKNFNFYDKKNILFSEIFDSVLKFLISPRVFKNPLEYYKFEK